MFFPTPNRPKNVSADATLVYPGQTFGPGFGVQQATLASIFSQVSHQNANTNLHFANAMRDWQLNADIYKGLNLPVPPPPASPKVINLKVTYADQAGNVIAGPEGASGLQYAWVEYV